MPFKIYLFLVIFLFVGCTKKIVHPQAVEYDIFLIAGQSNTHSGIGYNPSIDTYNLNILQLGRRANQNYKLLLAVEPLQHFTSNDSSIGFAMTFAKLYVSEYLLEKRKILLIPCGSNSSSFRAGDWNRGNPLYTDAVERVNFCLKEYPGSKIKGILWHQGESDVSFGVVYKNVLDGMISSIRNDISVIYRDSIPFIAGGLVPFWVSNTNNGTRIIDSILRDLPNRIPFAGFADPLLPFIIKKPNDMYDAIHFDAEGQREMGRRYFSAYRKLRI